MREYRQAKEKLDSLIFAIWLNSSLKNNDFDYSAMREEINDIIVPYVYRKELDDVIAVVNLMISSDPAARREYNEILFKRLLDLYSGLAGHQAIENYLLAKTY
ncbi:hypothetical protein DA718_18015 [Klebsiella huaxiensis]|uniref:Uncharacterized protein n=1 Tax=Klebsiella huaxiensis TaxID=2153354 RepID=A0ABT6EDS1_9ENTR|nr:MULTISPECIES: hypothetical protein [Klebsiella]MDG1642543.1 hypothetical protein [Klebsiella huaxiensis]QBG08941.1 hypothetical protein DA718_18015 [Klebsiella huaxiensis]HCB1501114.1 hypothetical protein [Klebsiella michiganensis]HCB1847488.1 hypothetical protein [Klebsiella oxytoca]